MTSNRMQLPNRATATGGMCVGARARAGRGSNLGALVVPLSLPVRKRLVGIAFD